MPELIKKSAAYKGKNYKQALIDGFVAIDKLLATPEAQSELSEISMKNSKFEPRDPAYNFDIPENMGCTACVVLITKKEIYVANAGDSRCVMCKNGIAIGMSEDHKPDLEMEKTRIEKAGGYVEGNRVNGCLNLSRSLGDLSYKNNTNLDYSQQLIIPTPDVRVEQITPDINFLIVACDGIWDCKTSQEAVDFVAKKLGKCKISKIVEDIMEDCIAKDINEKEGLGCDNMTCMVITINKDH